jgi:hypothetical protein
MSELKSKYYITPSSLASYFGCGFNSPEEQFMIDSGKKEPEFDDDSKLRMALGNKLEDAVIDYFQDEVFKAPITNRNSETKWGYDGKIRYKIDGILHKGDEKLVFENKISNSKSYRFTENKGYHMQVQSYLLCENLDAAILGGLYQGKPIWVKINRDEELIADIKRMADFVVNSLYGMVDFYDDFPTDLLEKYGNTKIYEPITNLSDSTKEYLHKLAKLNAKKSEIEKEIDALKKAHEDDYDITGGSYEDDVIKLKISTWTQKGSLDIDTLKDEHPEIDFNKYYGAPSERSRMTLTLK